MVKFSKLKVGQTVIVREWSGSITIGVIEEVYSDVKNGRPGIDYAAADGTYWCYLDQIESVFDRLTLVNVS